MDSSRLVASVMGVAAISGLLMAISPLRPDPSVAAPVLPTIYHQTSVLSFGFGEGVLLSQHEIPVRLPTNLAALDTSAGLTAAMWGPHPGVLPAVVVSPSAPVLSAHFVHLKKTRQMVVPGLASGVVYPTSMRTQGYAIATLDQGGFGFTSPIVSPHAANGSVLAFIGEPTSQTQLSPASQHVNLGAGVVGSWYVQTAKWPDGTRASYVAAALLTWREGSDTYAVYESGMMATITACKGAMVAWARSMARTEITRIHPMSGSLTWFDNNHVNPTTGTGGRLISQEINLGPARRPGYTDQLGVGYRVTTRSVPIASSIAPAWSPSASNQPAPLLGSAASALHQQKVPVYLPHNVPFKPGVWPRLTLQTTPSSYLVDIQTSTFDLPLNTPYAVGQGLGWWYGTVGGSTQPFPKDPYGPINAQPVLVSRLTPTALGQFVDRHSNSTRGVYYAGIVVLPSGVKAHLSIEFAGDGNHTRISFKMGRFYYEVSNYHHVREALQMAESMVRVPQGTAQS